MTYNPATGTAAWVDRSHDLGDIPVNDVARDDDVTGDLYASTDFGVFRLLAGTSDWGAAAPGLPNVEVAGLTIVSAERKLYRGDARAGSLAPQYPIAACMAYRGKGRPFGRPFLVIVVRKSVPERMTMQLTPINAETRRQLRFGLLRD